MGFGSSMSRRLSAAGSSYYEPSNGTSSASSTASKTRPGRHASVASRNPEASIVRASTVTSATTVSKLIRSASSASTSRESMPTSISSTLRPSTIATRISRASTARASTVTAATSTSNFIQSDSKSSIVRPPTSTPATSTTSLFRSGSKRAPSSFSNAASRFLWGRRPPGHSTLQPSQIASLTHILSLPNDTPMLSSLIGAQGVPISRSQFSPTPSCFCDAHFWLDQQHIEELTEVITHEIGPQLDKLRIAPQELISKRTKRILSILNPYKDIFTGIGIDADSRTLLNSSSSSSSYITPTCTACTLGRFFQSPDAVHALTTSVKSRKHRNRPWPLAMAWLEPNPGKGVDWEAEWKAQGKSTARDRIRVQRWRRENRPLDQQQPWTTTTNQIAGHGPGEGCDFCDGLRLERDDEEDLIAEDEEDAACNASQTSIVDDTASMSNSSTLINPPSSSSDSETFRAMREESIINLYLAPSSSSSSSSSSFWSQNTKPVSHQHYHDLHENERGSGSFVRGEGSVADLGGRRASQWARSYRGLVV